MHNSLMAQPHYAVNNMHVHFLLFFNRVLFKVITEIHDFCQFTSLLQMNNKLSCNTLLIITKHVQNVNPLKESASSS